MVEQTSGQAADGGTDPPVPPTPEWPGVVPGPEVTGRREISYEEFGVNWVRRILHKDRILRTVDEVLGDQIALGPIGAGPGRALATVSFVGRYHPTTGEEIPGDRLAYAINLPISVDFELGVARDTMRFKAEVVIPLVLEVHTEAPVWLRLDLRTPPAEEVSIELSSDTRRGAMVRKVAGMDGEIRRFLLRVVDTELSKAYVRRATHLDMEELIANAWPMLTEQFLPQGPDARTR